MDEKLERKKKEDKEEIEISNNHEYFDNSSLNEQFTKTCIIQNKLEKGIECLKDYKKQFKQQNNYETLNEYFDFESLQSGIENDFRLILGSNDLKVCSASNKLENRLVLENNKTEIKVKFSSVSVNEKILELENKIKFIETITAVKKQSMMEKGEKLINVIDEDCTVVYSKKF